MLAIPLSRNIFENRKQTRKRKIKIAVLFKYQPRRVIATPTFQTSSNIDLGDVVQPPLEVGVGDYR